MNKTATGDQMPAESAESISAADGTGVSAETLETSSASGESTTQADRETGETAREVAAQHFARLMYAPTNAWSRYVFHENDPYPAGPARRRQGKGRG